MPTFEQYYFTFDTKQRVVASSNPQNNSTIEDLCMASSFDSDTYSKSRQLMYDSYNENFLFLETHRLRNTYEGRAARFIHSYQLREKSVDPRHYLAPVDFYDGEDGNYRTSAALPQYSFERSRKTVKGIVLYYLSSDPLNQETSIEEVRNKLEKIILTLYKNIVFGFDKLLIHWVGKSDDELCEDGCDITLMMHLLTPPSRRKFLSADTNILGSTSLTKKLNFTNTTIALRKAGTVMEINNGNVEISGMSASIETVCKLLAEDIADAALTSDDTLQKRLNELDEWISSVVTSAIDGDELINLGLYAFLGKGNASSSECDMNLSKFSEVISPQMWKNAEKEFKKCVQLLLDDELVAREIKVQQAAFDKVLSLAKQVGKYVNCTAGEYYEIFANSLALLHSRDAGACAELCKELKNLHGGINSAASRMINREGTDEEQKKLLKSVQSDLIELPAKFESLEQLSKYIEDFPQLMGEYSPYNFIRKSVDFYLSAENGKSIIDVFGNYPVIKSISSHIAKSLNDKDAKLIPELVKKFIADGVHINDETVWPIIEKKLKESLSSDSVSIEEIRDIIDIANNVDLPASFNSEIEEVCRKKLDRARNTDDFKNVVEKTVIPLRKECKFDFYDMAVGRATQLCKYAFTDNTAKAPDIWDKRLTAVYECIALLDRSAKNSTLGQSEFLTSSAVDDGYKSYRSKFDESIKESLSTAITTYENSHCINLSAKLCLENLRRLRSFVKNHLHELNSSYDGEVESAFANALLTCNSIDEINDLNPKTQSEIDLATNRLAEILDDMFRDVKTLSAFDKIKCECQSQMNQSDIRTCLITAANAHLSEIEEGLKIENANNIENAFHSNIIIPYLNGTLKDIFTCRLELNNILRKHGGASEFINAIDENNALSKYFSDLYFNENYIIDDTTICLTFGEDDSRIYEILAKEWVERFNYLTEDPKKKKENFSDSVYMLNFVGSPNHDLAIAIKNEIKDCDFSSFVCDASMEELAQFCRIVYIANEKTVKSYYNRTLTLIASKGVEDNIDNLSDCCYLIAQLSLCEEAGMLKKFTSKCGKVCNKLLKKCKKIISKIYNPAINNNIEDCVKKISKGSRYYKKLRNHHIKAQREYQKETVVKTAKKEQQTQKHNNNMPKAKTMIAKVLDTLHEQLILWIILFVLMLLFAIVVRLTLGVNIAIVLLFTVVICMVIIICFSVV